MNPREDRHQDCSLADLNDAAENSRIEAFVEEHGGTVFHRPAWLRAVERGTGNKALGLISERAGTLTGWLPLSHVTSPFFGSALVSSAFGVGGGVLTEHPADTQTLCEKAQDLAEQRSIRTIELRGGIAGEKWQKVEGRHSSFERELANDDEAQLLAIPRKARAEIRKSFKNSLQISIGTSQSDRLAHYAVYSESVRNLGTPVFPRSLFDEVLDLFGDHADILTINHDGVPVASVLSLYHRQVVMPFWGGGTPKARQLRANERMYYELMLHARKKACLRFDFGRSKVESGPYFFKKNWGFEPQPLTYWTWTRPGVETRNIDPNDERYSAKIDIWKRLPLPVANLIGPWISRGLG